MIYIYIIIISKSRWQHGFPRLSLSIFSYIPLFLEDHPDNISCPHSTDTSTIFKQSLIGWNSEFSFKTSFYTKIKELILPYYLSIAGGRIVGKWKMQTVSSRIRPQIHFQRRLPLHYRHLLSADVSSCWLANTGVSMTTSPLKNVAFESSVASTAVAHTFCSSYLDGLGDGR